MVGWGWGGVVGGGYVWWCGDGSMMESATFIRHLVSYNAGVIAIQHECSR